MTNKDDSKSRGEWARDLRGWLLKLAQENELKTVTVPVGCDGEIQEIGRQMSKRKGPAVLFENIVGHQSTWCRKLFVGSLNTVSKLALSLGLSRDAAMGDVVSCLRQTMRAPTDPVRVESGPVQQNKILGNDIDIRHIPVPKWHPGDQGRYINLWAGIVTRDPDTGEYNVGAYRGVIHGPRQIGVLLFRTQGWGQHYDKYIARGEPMPVACVYGWDPSLMLAAGTPITVLDEWQWIGAMRGEPVPLVPCETIDLEVPATAEIVIEGTISPDPATYLPEGPLKEVSGRYCHVSPMPVIEVSGVMHRSDPIMVGSAIGIAPVAEEQVLTMAAGTTAVLRNALDDQGIPGVLDLTLSPFFAVKINKTYQGQAYQIACALFGHKALNMRYKILVIVEDDVDLSNPKAVLAAIYANADPARDLYIFPTQRNLVDTAMSMADSDAHAFGGTLGNKMLIDATVNWIAHPRQERWGGGRRAPWEPPPKDDVEKVAQRWKEYGFE